MGSQKNQDSIFYKITEFMWIIILPVALMVLFVSIILRTTNENGRVLKSDIQRDIQKVISNGANLEVVKLAYISREKKDKSIGDILWFHEKEYYNYSVPLSQILNDILKNEFLKDEPDTLLTNKISDIIYEHYQVNPFDKLEDQQREYFENIRIKMGSDYIIIQPEVNKVVDELYKKNLLVDKYLRNATVSFWISITALFLTIVLSIYQIYQNRGDRIVKLFNQALP